MFLNVPTCWEYCPWVSRILEFHLQSQVFGRFLRFFACTVRLCKFRRWGCLDSETSRLFCSISSFGQVRFHAACGPELRACKFLSVSRGMLSVLDLVWTHDGLSVRVFVIFGRPRGVGCLANISFIPISLTFLTTHCLGTERCVIMASEPVRQIEHQHLVQWTNE